jgi:hypothetical protein
MARDQGQLAVRPRQDICALCGIPLDSRYFDNSNVDKPPDPGKELLLASFELPPEYCGILEYFAQFTDRQAKHPEEIRTPELEWILRLNGRPLDPYFGFRYLLNSWDYATFRVAIRLDDTSRLEFAVRGTGSAPPSSSERIKVVGGRLVGRYWYNPVYGDVVRHRP